MELFKLIFVGRGNNKLGKVEVLLPFELCRLCTRALWPHQRDWCIHSPQQVAVQRSPSQQKMFKLQSWKMDKCIDACDCSEIISPANRQIYLAGTQHCADSAVLFWKICMFSTPVHCVDTPSCSQVSNAMLHWAPKTCLYLEYSKEMYKMKLAC